MSVLKGVRRALAIVAPTAALLLVPAGLIKGEWLWPQGLTFLAIFGAATIAANVALAVWRPASFAVRGERYVADEGKRQPQVDAVGLVAYVAFILAWVVFIPVDVFSLRLLPPPPGWVASLGLAMALAGSATANLAVWQNRFASPAIQHLDGKRVIDSGVYAWIRHPLYSGNLMLFAGAALWLGSTAAFVATAVHLVATLARIRIEEAHLRMSLPAYADYVRRVRGRLVPFVL